MRRAHENLLFLALVCFAFLVTAGGFWVQGTLYWDTGKIFTQFRDNLHSLNHFGEIAWWFPHTLSGFPGYYHSILGIPSSSNPMAALVGVTVWILGRLGVRIQSYHAIYVFYFGFLIPFFFLWAFRSVLEKFFKSKIVIWFALILAAFSPGIAFNLSDTGYLEPQIYILFFVSAYLGFLKSPELRRFWCLCLSLLLIGLSLNHAFLYFGVLFLPLFVLLTRRALWRAIGRISRAYWGVAALLFLIGAAPNLVAFTQGKGIIRTSIGDSKHYPYEKLEAGSPLETLTVGIAGFGFDWRAERQNWAMLPESTKYHTAYNYLGLLCMPFILVGLLFGNLRLRYPLFGLMVFFFGAVALASYSPIFSSLLAWESPFRSCSHFSDATFKAGGYLLLIFAAAMGLKVLIQRKRLRGSLFLTLYSVCWLGAVLVSLYILDRKALESLHFGLLLFFGFALFIVLYWFSFSKTYWERSKALRLLLVMALVDISTICFLHVRSIWKSELMLNSGWPALHRVDETPNGDNVGLVVGSSKHFYPSILMVYEPYFQMIRQAWNPTDLPENEIYYSAHYALSIAQEKKRFLDEGAGWETSLPMESTRFIGERLSVVPRKAWKILRKTYNELQYQVSSDRSGMFFIRDGYSPYWSATVNGIQVPVERAYFNFKAVQIPAGESVVRLKFEPPLVKWALLLAYLSVFIVGLRVIGDHFSFLKTRSTIERLLAKVFPVPSEA